MRILALLDSTTTTAASNVQQVLIVQEKEEQGNAIKVNTLELVHPHVLHAHLGHTQTKRAAFNVRLPNVGGMPLGPTKATIEGRMDKNNVGEGFIAHQAAQLVKNVQPGLIAIPQRHASPLCVNLEDSRPMKVPATVQSVLQGHTLTGMDRHLVANAAPGASKVLPGRPTARPAQNKHDLMDKERSWSHPNQDPRVVNSVMRMDLVTQHLSQAHVSTAL